MKKLLTLIIVSLFFIQVHAAYGQTETPTATATPSGIIDQTIKDLKDKIATKVAELRKDNERIITGAIDSVDKGKIVLAHDQTKYTLTYDDALVKVYSVISGKKEIKVDDLEKGNYLIAYGTSIDNSITTNILYLDVPYLVTSGKAADLDTTAQTVRVITTEKDDVTLSIDKKTTKITLLDIKTNTLTPATFAKIKEGDSIHFAAQNPGGKIDKLTASRIVIIPQELFIKK